MTDSFKRTLALVAACVVLVAALVVAIVSRRGVGTTGAPEDATAAYLGTPLVPQKRAADAILRDGEGRPTHVIDRNVPTTMLFFGYTHCPDTCPLALGSLARAYRLLSPAARARTRIVFVSVDPARDTPAVVTRFVHRFGSHVVGLTGDARTLARLEDAYGVRADTSTHDVAHGDTVYLVDSAGRVLFIYPPETSANDFAHDLALRAQRGPSQRSN